MYTTNASELPVTAAQRDCSFFDLRLHAVYRVFVAVTFLRIPLSAFEMQVMPPGRFGFILSITGSHDVGSLESSTASYRILVLKGSTVIYIGLDTNAFIFVHDIHHAVRNAVNPSVQRPYQVTTERPPILKLSIQGHHYPHLNTQ